MNSDIRIKIRDWDVYFEADRTRQWKSLKWVPVPNKQGLGYKKIMQQKNGAEIFGCWNAIVQQSSLCSPRGDLSKYSLQDISLNTMIPFNILSSAISFIIQNLDWIEVVENLDRNVNDLDRNVNDLDSSVLEPAVGSSILCNSILCNSMLSSLDLGVKDKRLEPEERFVVPPTIDMVTRYCTDRNNGIDPQSFIDHYEARGWKPKGYTSKMKDWQAAIRTWEKNKTGTNKKGGIELW